MAAPRLLPAPLMATAVGLVALASGMGIGRFAFTPMLPLMQQAFALSLVEGGWLASANYAGYLAGALALLVLDPAPATSARAGLAAVALLTLAMAGSELLEVWLLLRFLAGVASACVLVGALGWALPMLVREGGTRSAGIVLAGVGVGIALAGMVGLAAGIARVTPAQAWLALGAFASIAAAATWTAFGRSVAPIPAEAPDAPVRPPCATRLVLCYGAFGFGYIIPATFLPALARQAIADASLFGWVWPVFGVAAAGSTIAAARWLRRFPPVVVWAASHLVMACGVIAPAVFAGAAALVVSAICVGGTFMVVTMAGMEQARRVAAAAAPRLIAAMTAAFAFGQLVGPLTLRPGASGDAAALLWPSAGAAAALVASALVLLVNGATNPVPLPSSRKGTEA